MHVSPALLLQWKCLLFSPILLMNIPRLREPGINSTRSDCRPVAGLGFWPKFVSISTRWYCYPFYLKLLCLLNLHWYLSTKVPAAFCRETKDSLRRGERPLHSCPQVAPWSATEQINTAQTDTQPADCAECLCRVACHLQVGGQQDPVSSLW